MTGSHPKMDVLCVGTLLLFFIVLGHGPAFSETIENGPKGNGHVETYRYEAMPEGRQNEKEEMILTLSFKEDSSEYISTIVSAKSDERITLDMTKGGS